MKAQRILLLGSGGSGKSTLARRLGERTGLPVIHLDREYWRENWTPTPKDEWNARVGELISGERWIIDGNFGGTLPMRLQAADTVIFFDLSRWVCLRSVLGRCRRYRGKSRTDMAPGCPEKADAEFLRWVLRFPEKEAPQIRALLQGQAGRKNVHILKHRREADELLRRWEELYD